MKTITTIEDLLSVIENEIENSRRTLYFALRGATKHDLELLANGRDYLDVSCDDWDDLGDCAYTEDKLDGSSGIKIADYMFDEYFTGDKMRKVYEAARFYAESFHDTDTVLLIGDNYLSGGNDDNEVVIGADGYGANVYAIVKL